MNANLKKVDRVQMMINNIAIILNMMIVYLQFANLKVEKIIYIVK